MNKVINIEIAKQVFWIEEKGYQVLQAYLDKIQQQLVDDESGEEIFIDIELRLAELLYDLNGNKDRAISVAQLMAIIDQVGFIDSDDLAAETTRKIYLDNQNKVLAGVCAGLSMRLGIPAFLLRLSFLGLVFFFGFGVLLYLIFWFSFEKNSNRNSALAAQGKSPTAKLIAAGAEVKFSPFLRLQRVVFLPFSLLGALLNVIANSFIAKRKTYILLTKNALLAFSIFLLIVLSVSIVEFNHDQIYPAWVQWLLSAATVYLMVLVSVIFIRDFYLAKPRIRVAKTLKLAAIVPVFLLCSGVIFLASEMIDEHSDVSKTNYLVNGNTFSLKLNEADSDNQRARKVNIRVKTTSANDNNVKVSITYSSNGRGDVSLKQNIQGIDYKFNFNNNTLLLNRYFELQQYAYNRGQEVSVLVELPQNMQLLSSHPLQVEIQGNSYDYGLKNSRVAEVLYVAAGQYFHENNEINRQRISNNERAVLWSKFCQQFFQQAQWQCSRNIEKQVTQNRNFKQAFADEATEIEKIRRYLVPEQMIELSNLVQINEHIEFLKSKYPSVAEFQSYIQHLATVKNRLLPEQLAPG